MEEFEQKLSALLSNPETMQKIASLAQSLGQEDAEKAENKKENAQQNPSKENHGSIDLSMVQKLSGFMQHNNIDQQQRALLQALRPYLSRSRLNKLENAMRAAKMARLASSVIGSGGLQPFGRR